jgi:hypothetical protein
MAAISIHDAGKRRGAFLSFDLIDLLWHFEPLVLLSRWRVSEVHFFAVDSALDDGEWDYCSDGAPILSGKEMMRLAAGAFVTYQGNFAGTLPGKKQCWIKIKAVEARYFVVSSNLPVVIDLLKSHYRDIRPGKPKKGGER